MYIHTGCSQVAASPFSTASTAQPQSGPPTATPPEAAPAESPAIQPRHVLPDSTGHWQPPTVGPAILAGAGWGHLGAAYRTCPPQSSALLLNSSAACDQLSALPSRSYDVTVCTSFDSDAVGAWPLIHTLLDKGVSMLKARSFYCIPITVQTALFPGVAVWRHILQNLHESCSAQR